MAGIGDMMKDVNTGREEDAKKAGKKAERLASEDIRDVFNALVARVKKGETVSIQGLGNFRMVDRKATTARNPRTGNRFSVGESKRVKFTISKTLKDEINGRPAAAPTP